jgi:phosphoribosylglycinamide formyltransferase 1
VPCGRRSRRSVATVWLLSKMPHRRRPPCLARDLKKGAWTSLTAPPGGEATLTSEFILLTEDTFHAGYLVARWQEEFRSEAACNGVLLRATKPTDELLLARKAFHAQFRERHTLDRPTWSRLERLYPGLDKTDRAMVAAFGVPPGPAGHDRIGFLDHDVNGQRAREWLTKQCAGGCELFVFVFLDRILEPWWIELTHSRIVNAHSAVLPGARGMFAIEQIAATRDLDRFRRSAGATAHYVDTGVDTGPIICGEQFADPFGFISIWDCKAHSFSLAFDILIRLSRRLTARPGVVPIGTSQDPATVGTEFKRADFTPERRRQAEFGYVEMRHRIHGS